MDNEKFQIDVAAIWQFWIDRNDQYLLPQRFVQKLYEELKIFFLKKGKLPFISAEMVEKDSSLSNYYNNYKKRIELSSDRPVDFFQHAGGFYDMAESCSIRLEDVSKEEFSYLLALQIVGYRTVAETAAFLDYHLSHSFSDDTGLCSFPLKLLLNHLEAFKATEKYYLVTMWQTLRLEQSTVHNAEDNLKEAHEVDSQEAFDNTLNQPSGESVTKDVALSQIHARGGRAIPGKFSDEEISHFFSFLHQCVNEMEQPFLAKEHVDEIFANGLIVPETTRDSKFSLNISHRFPKKIVDYFIHVFFSKHNPRAKGEILRFFGSHIRQYESALDPERHLGVKNNLTGEQPRNLYFDIKNFLPERFQ